MTMMTLLPGQAERRLLLASQSPRRRQLLAEAGVRFEVRAPAVDDGELVPGSTSARAWVAALAYLKAEAARLSARDAGRRLDGVTILGADTVVVCDDTLIGKPRDARDARAIIKRLEGRPHEVLTGVALVDGASGSRRLLVDAATVNVGTIGDGAIDAYIASGRWAGKAGAYNLDEQVRAGWPIAWRGDPGTVMGLPMRSLIALGWLDEFMPAARLDEVGA